jgi:hypothetical protein
LAAQRSCCCHSYLEPRFAEALGPVVAVYLIWIVWFVGLYLLVGLEGIGAWLLGVSLFCFIGWLLGWMDENVL